MRKISLIVAVILLTGCGVKRINIPRHDYDHHMKAQTCPEPNTQHWCNGIGWVSYCKHLEKPEAQCKLGATFYPSPPVKVEHIWQGW